MKLQDLSKLIQEIVRKEIRSAIKEEMKDVKFLVEVLTEASPKKTIVQEQPKKPYVAPNTNINFGVKDKTLNSLLMETANSITNNDYKNVMNFNSNDIPQFGKQQFTDINNQPVQVSPELSNILTKDYSALMDNIASKQK